MTLIAGQGRFRDHNHWSPSEGKRVLIASLSSVERLAGQGRLAGYVQINFN